MHKAWYVVWVATGQEKDIYLALQKVPGVERTLFPVEPIWERKDGVWTQRETVIFPGYIFIECKMDSAIYYKIKGMPHVLGWLGKDTMWPSTVRQEEMDVLLQVMGCVEAGADPRQWLQDVTVSARQRRGYGTLTIHGKAYQVPFNVYKGEQAASEGEGQGPDSTEHRTREAQDGVQ